mmetsp:Transcript_23533/g.51056  ORF Transcript_23533/g.51056 Transcript_23533/m.51056 type:complete len:906 (-) Transcript_23533:734-3451(-)
MTAQTPVSPWWEVASSGLFIVCTIVSTTLAFQNQHQRGRFDKEDVAITPSVKAGEPSSEQSSRKNSRKDSLSTWGAFRGFTSMDYLSKMTDSILLLGAGCCSLYMVASNRKDDETTNLLSWTSGFLATLSLQRHITRPSSTQRDDNNNTLLWLVLYTTAFPLPIASKSERSDKRKTSLFFASCASLQLWQRLKVDSGQGEPKDERPTGRLATRGEDRQQQQQQQQQEQNGRDDNAVLLFPPSIPGKMDTASSLTQNDPRSPPTLKKSKRYLEILVHNVSHTDLVLSVEPPKGQISPPVGNSPSNGGIGTESNPFCLCRPRFSWFDHFCRAILDNLSMKETIVSFPRYQRQDDTRYSINAKPMNSGPIPTGLQLSTDSRVQANLGQIRVRGRDQTEVCGSDGRALVEKSLRVNHVFFPLLATLLPRWEAMIADKQYRGREVKRVLILVSGVGTPRNFTHSEKGNSTEACAYLMEHMVRLIDPGITVVRIFSETNIFRYDDNLLFVQQDLLPVINSYRDAHAHGIPYPDEQRLQQPYPTKSSVRNDTSFDGDWRQSLSVTLSFADGSPARTYAIQAGLRPYRPIFFHFWQLKTFWHESKIVDDDLEVHSFEAMETSPAVDINQITDDQMKLVVEEMMKFKDEMLQTLQNGTNDIKKFWLRKTHKPVLAVLLVQGPGSDGEPRLYRGTNMEVSMPTGSLCAERNVIGTALAANPNLKREDLKMVAVLAVPPPAEDIVFAATNNIAASSNSDDPTTGLKRMGSTASIGTMTGSVSELNFFNDRKISIGSEADDRADSTNVSLSGQDGGKESSSEPVRKIDLYPSLHKGQNPKQIQQSLNLSASAPGTPRNSKKKKFVVVNTNKKDLNPLKPCGACNEWLKKISEANPYFKVVTFTDSNCNGVYCMPCQE